MSYRGIKTELRGIKTEIVHIRSVAERINEYTNVRIEVVKYSFRKRGTNVYQIFALKQLGRNRRIC